ncbi:MAG: YiiD C-terminal domain-containing protein [Candidatus Latescibacterota bacterium]|nr:YiiD C-terminal domain-containing protein [Candidatus Latescibacterota bacterium]
MSPESLEAYLHEQIPLSRHMGVAVQHLDDSGIRLCAPLVANINHQGTIFAGSASAVAMLAGWSLVHVRLRERSDSAKLVIRRNDVQFFRPMNGDAEAWCGSPDPEAWDAFYAGLAERGQGRIELVVELSSAGEPAAMFRGEYAAVRS